MADLSFPHAPGAPARMPLVDRKNIRDGFEAKKSELEQAFSQILGEPWKIHVDTQGVYSYVNARDPDDNSRTGDLIARYFEDALDSLHHFAESKSDYFAVINQTATSRAITLEPTDREDISYAGTDFKDGRWRLLFRDKNIGVNTGDVLLKLEKVLNAASKSSGASLSVAAQCDIRDGYEASVKEVLAQARKLLNSNDIVFEPNFEANYAAVAAFAATPDSDLRKSWDAGLGRATLTYFKSFVDRLELQGFGKDDMMQEAFHEMVPTHVVAFVVTDEVERQYNDCVVKNDKLLIRTKASQWWTNADNACDMLVELL